MCLAGCRPPLKPNGGPIDVLALSADSTQLLLVRFPAKNNQWTAPPTLVWTAALPAKPVSIAAALAPYAQQSRRHVAFALMRDKGIDVYHSSFGDSGALAPFTVAHIGTGQLIQDAPPGLYVDAEGRAHVGVLAVSPAAEGNYRCALAEVVFPPGGALAAERPAMTPLHATIPHPTEATVFYYLPPTGPVRREILIRTAGGVLRCTGEATMAPLSVPGNPASPMLLTPGKQNVYLLYFEPQRGFHLEPL